MGHMYRMNLLFDELGITDDQRLGFKKLFKEHRKDIQPLAENVIAKRRVLRELILAEAPDQGTIRQASADLGNAIADAAVQASALAKEARSILTPEQVERFKRDAPASSESLRRDSAQLAGAKRRILIGRPPPDLHDILFQEGVLANLWECQRLGGNGFRNRPRGHCRQLKRRRRGIRPTGSALSGSGGDANVAVYSRPCRSGRAGARRFC